MGASYTAVNRLSTEIDDLNQTRIETNIQETMVRDVGWMNGSLCNVQDFSGPGTVTQVNMEPGLSMTQTSESATTGMGDVTVAWSTSNRQITAYLHAVDVVLTKVALEANIGNIEPYIIRAGVRAGLKAVETAAVALYTEAPASSPDHEIGVSGTPPDWAAITAAVELLLQQDAEGQYIGVFHTEEWSALASIDELNNAQYRGRGVIEKGVDTVTGWTELGTDNLKIVLSNRVVQTGGNQNMIFAKEAIGLRIKERFTIGIDKSRLNVGERAVIIGMSLWFGIGGQRDTSMTNKFMVNLTT